MKRYEADFDKISSTTQVYQDGRRREVYFNPAKHDLAMWGLGIPVSRRRWPHPAYVCGGYPAAVRYEYEMILIDFFTRPNWRSLWSDGISEMAAGLVFPDNESLSDYYRSKVAYDTAVTHAVRALRPELVEALAPFAGRHGLNALPWGLGWLCRMVPQMRTDQCVEIKISLSPTSPERHWPDPRTTPCLDALLL